MLLFAIQKESGRIDIESAMAVRFEPHESLYFGGDYWQAHVSDGTTSLRIQHNRDLLWREGDPDSERFAFPDHSDHELILVVENETPDVLEKLHTVPQLEFLGSDG